MKTLVQGARKALGKYNTVVNQGNYICQSVKAQKKEWAWAKDDPELHKLQAKLDEVAGIIMSNAGLQKSVMAEFAKLKKELGDSVYKATLVNLTDLNVQMDDIGDSVRILMGSFGLRNTKK